MGLGLTGLPIGLRDPAIQNTLLGRPENTRRQSLLGDLNALQNQPSGNQQAKAPQERPKQSKLQTAIDALAILGATAMDVASGGRTSNVSSVTDAQTARREGQRQEAAFDTASSALPEDLRALAATLGPEARQAFVTDFLSNQTRSVTPTSAQRNFEALRSQGVPEDRARAIAFGSPPQTLTTDQRNFDALVSQGLSPEQARSIAFGSGSKPSSLQERINALVASGVDRATAQRIAAGAISVDTNPITGETVIIDKSAPSSTTGQPSSSRAPLTKEVRDNAASNLDETERALRLLYGVTESDVREATGLKSNLDRLGGRISGVFGGPVAQDTERATALINNVNQQIISALTNSPRNPVTEQQLIRRNLLLNPQDFFANPQAEVIKLDEIRKLLEGNQDDLRDLLGLDPVQRTGKNLEDMTEAELRNLSDEELRRMAGQ